MKHITGDIITLCQAGKFDILVHGCNCYHTMGSGVAKQVKKAFPKAYEVDLKTRRGDVAKLGTCSVTSISRNNQPPIRIINAYTQFGYGTGLRHVEYGAVRSCFKFVRDFVSEPRYTTSEKPPQIAYPKIGTRLGGGDWEIVKRIIDEELLGLDHTLVTLPEDATTPPEPKHSVYER